MVIVGKQAIDDDSNATGQMLAGLMDWSQAAYASEIAVDGGGKKCFSTIMMTVMHQFEDTCHNIMHWCVNLVWCQSLYNMAQMFFISLIFKSVFVTAAKVVREIDGGLQTINVKLPGAITLIVSYMGQYPHISIRPFSSLITSSLVVPSLLL